MDLQTAKSKTANEIFAWLLNEYADDSEAIELITDYQQDTQKYDEPKRWRMAMDCLVGMTSFY